jgi:hypothetical protein
MFCYYFTRPCKGPIHAHVRYACVQRKHSKHKHIYIIRMRVCEYVSQPTRRYANHTHVLCVLCVLCIGGLFSRYVSTLHGHTLMEQTYTRAQQTCTRAQQTCTRAQQTCTRAQQTCTRAQQTCTRAIQTSTRAHTPVLYQKPATKHYLQKNKTIPKQLQADKKKRGKHLHTIWREFGARCRRHGAFGWPLARSKKRASSST